MVKYLICLMSFRIDLDTSRIFKQCCLCGLIGRTTNSVDWIRTHLEFAGVDNVYGNVNIEEEAEQETGTACQQVHH